MKFYSDNIRAKAGILALRNLNVFPAGELDTNRPWGELFREACRRAAVTAKQIIEHESEVFGTAEDRVSLPALSIPRFEILGGGRYKLTGGLFLWGGYLFQPGAILCVTETDYRIETPELAQLATAVPIKEEEVRYDTYNGSKLEEISDEVLKELDVTLDRDKLYYAYSDEPGTKTWDDLENNGKDGLLPSSSIS